MMIKQIKAKIKQGWEFVKRQWKKLLVILGIGVVLAAGNILTPDKIPSVVAEGQVIEFPYTDENSNEDLIIYTDKEIYTPLWAWNGFDVYVAVENKSGESQPISFQSFFSKDFSIEKVSLLNPTATTTIKESIYEDICKEVIATSSKATTTICHQEKTGEKDKVVLGVWIPTVQQQFSKEAYDKTISDNKIKVKQKIGGKVRGNFIDYSLKGEFSYYKLRIKSNEPFSKEEFDLEIIGGKGGYGLLDPTIFEDDINSYIDGNADGQGSWVRNSGTTNVQGTTTYEGTKAFSQAGSSVYRKTGTLTNDGRISVYMRSTGAGGAKSYRNFQLTEGTSQRIVIGTDATGSGKVDYLNATPAWVNFATYTANVWFLVEIEWRSVDKKVRYRVDEGTWTTWVAPYTAWTSGVDTVWIGGDGTDTGYFDYIAENPYVAPSAEAPPQMEVIIIGG